MSEWIQERKCLHCEATFSLSDHGHFGAQGLAETLERENHLIDLDDPESIINKCPPCAGQLSDVDPMGMIESLQISEQKKTKQDNRRTKIFIGVGCLSITLGALALIIVLFASKFFGANP